MTQKDKETDTQPYLHVRSDNDRMAEQARTQKDKYLSLIWLLKGANIKKGVQIQSEGRPGIKMRDPKNSYSFD